MSPRSDSLHPYRAAIEIRREGEWLRVPALTPVLPPRCAVCNAPATERVRRTLHRIARPDSSAMFVAILLLCWPALLWLKPVFVDYGLCAAHARRTRLESRVAKLGVLGCALGALVAIAAGRTDGVLLLVVIGLVISIAATRRHAILKIHRRDGDAILLAVPGPFLESFPSGRG